MNFYNEIKFLGFEKFMIIKSILLKNFYQIFLLNLIIDSRKAFNKVTW